MARTFVARGARRKTQWGGFGDTAGAANLPAFISIASGASAIISQAAIVGGGAGFISEEVTLTRMIGSLTAVINDDTALAEGTVAIGCTMALQAGINAGTGSLPDLETSPDHEWIYYTTISLRNPQNALRDGPVAAMIRSFDVKSQRKVKTGFSFVWIAEAQAVAFRVAVGGRYLVKLA